MIARHINSRNFHKRNVNTLWTEVLTTDTQAKARIRTCLHIQFILYHQGITKLHNFKWLNVNPNNFLILKYNQKFYWPFCTVSKILIENSTSPLRPEGINCVGYKISQFLTPIYFLKLILAFSGLKCNRWKKRQTKRTRMSRFKARLSTHTYCPEFFIIIFFIYFFISYKYLYFFNSFILNPMISIPNTYNNSTHSTTNHS